MVHIVPLVLVLLIDINVQISRGCSFLYFTWLDNLDCPHLKRPTPPPGMVGKIFGKEKKRKIKDLFIPLGK